MGQRGAGPRTAAATERAQDVDPAPALGCTRAAVRVSGAARSRLPSSGAFARRHADEGPHFLLHQDPE